MRITFLITALTWCVYSLMTFNYSGMELSLRQFADVELIFQFTAMSLGVGFFSIVISILGFVLVKKRGSILIGIISILISLLLGFLGVVTLNDVGAQIHEVSALLIGLGVLQAVFMVILSAMYKSKKAKA